MTEDVLQVSHISKQLGGKPIASLSEVLAASDIEERPDEALTSKEAFANQFM